MKHYFVTTGLIAIAVAISIAQPVLCDQPAVKDFTLPSATDGSLIHLADYAGKVVLINWWRSDCGWSKRESLKLVGLYQKYRSKGLVILGISDDTAPTVANVPGYLKQYSITWPVGLNDQGEFMREIRPNGQGETPGNYLVSRRGELTYLGLDRGDAAWQKLEEAVTRALAEPAPPRPPISRRALDPAPPLSLPDLHAKTIKLANFAGRPLVFNFFNAETCDWAGAVFAKLYSNYSGRGVEIVGIDLFDNDDQLKACMAKYNVRYPVLRGDQATQLAWIGGNKAWATFFVTPDGKLFKKIVDSIDKGIEEPVFTKYADYLVRGAK